MPTRVQVWSRQVRPHVDFMEEVLGRVSHPDILEALQAIDELCDQAASLRVVMVQEARRQDATWDDIGKALRISRQAAWERFRDISAECRIDPTRRQSANGSAPQ